MKIVNISLRKTSLSVLAVILILPFISRVLRINADEVNWVDDSECIASACGTSQGTKTQALYQETCDFSCQTIIFSTEDFGPINVTYDKSSDPNHCHKPTPESLNIPPKERGEYGKLVNELDTIKTNCRQVVADTRTVDCNDAEIVECQVSPTPTTDPVCVWMAESECSAECGGGVQDWYNRGEGCDNAYQERICNTQACEPTQGGQGCVTDGLLGFLNYTGNHFSTLPVTGEVWNPAEDSCADYAYLHIFGSMNRNPESEGWLESQVHVTSYTMVVPEGNEHTLIGQSFDNSEFCWYQVDLVPVDSVRIPPYYSGSDMIDYVFVQGTNPECDNDENNGGGDPEATPTPTPTSTPGTGGNSDTSDDSHSDPSSESSNDSEEGSVLGASTLADTGSSADYNIMLGLVLTAISGYGLKAKGFKIKDL